MRWRPSMTTWPGWPPRSNSIASGILAFTAKRPAQVFLRDSFGLKGPPAYGLQPQRIGRTRLFVLPSTSGSGVRYWDIAPWQALKALVDES